MRSNTSTVQHDFFVFNPSTFVTNPFHNMHETEFQVIKTFQRLGTLICRNQKYGLVDSNNKELVPCVMDSIEIIPDLGCCYTGKGSLRGFYSNELGYIPTIYDNIAVYDTHCEVVYHAMPGYLNEHKKFVLSKDILLNQPLETLRDELQQEFRRKMQKGVLQNLGSEYRYHDSLSQITYGMNGNYVIRLYGRQFIERY